MGKRGKNQRRQRTRHFRGGRGEAAEDGDLLPSSAYDLPAAEAGEQGEDEEDGDEEGVGDGYDEQVASPCKFQLYQKSVQSPKGDISYMNKFFLTYVGGRLPLHLQEDFCGTALLSTEWIRGDPRRTAVGLDLDLEALTWCLENNLTKSGADSYSRLSLFHGNVLHPQEARLVKPRLQDLLDRVSLDDPDALLKTLEQPEESDPTIQASTPIPVPAGEVNMKKNCVFPARDIICAFNYSCCCLQRRAELVLYFRHVLDSLSKRGGIFVMDIYGGTSSEHKLQLKRKFSNFTYMWEQAEFDILSRKTRISLHFQLGKKETLRHAFSYNWRLWSLPEIKDCLEEAGFQSVHFWIREMPDTQEVANLKEFNAASNVKYEECSSFQQRDAWNAYIVGVAK